MLLGSEWQYGELKGWQQRMMTLGEHELHEWESPIVQLEWQCQALLCVPSSNPCLVLYRHLGPLRQSNKFCIPCLPN
jgi:hypothetical protein